MKSGMQGIRCMQWCIELLNYILITGTPAFVRLHAMIHLQQYNCTNIYNGRVLIKHCKWRHFYCAKRLSLFFEEGGSYTWHTWPLHLLANHLHNFLLVSAPSLAVLVPALFSMAAVSKTLTPLPRISDRSGAEVVECRESHTLRFDKCLQHGKALARTISL